MEIREEIIEHNKRTTDAVEAFVFDVQKAKDLLLKCDYVVLTKKEAAQLRRDRSYAMLCALIAAFSAGIVFCIYIMG